MPRARTVEPEVTDLLGRVATAAEDVEDALAALKQRRAQRWELVHEAADSGISHRAIAKALGSVPALVTKILATPDPTRADDDE